MERKLSTNDSCEVKALFNQWLWFSLTNLSMNKTHWIRALTESTSDSLVGLQVKNTFSDVNDFDQTIKYVYTYLYMCRVRTYGRRSV